MKTLRLLPLFLLLSITTFSQVSLGIYPLATASGTDTYIATVTPGPDSYTTGQRFNIRFTNANTGPATLNLNSLGAKSIVRNSSTALSAGDISAGQVMLLVYDGTNMQVVGDGGGSLTASDGLTKSGNTIHIGGPVLGTRTLTLGASGGLSFLGSSESWGIQLDEASQLMYLASGISNLIVDGANGTITLQDDNPTPKGLLYGGTGYETTDFSVISRGFANTNYAPISGSLNYAPISGSLNYWKSSGTTNLTAVNTITSSTTGESPAVTFSNTLTANNFNQTLTGLKISPTFNDGAFGNLVHTALEVNGNVQVNESLEATRVFSGKLDEADATHTLLVSDENGGAGPYNGILYKSNNGNNDRVIEVIPTLFDVDISKEIIIGTDQSAISMIADIYNVTTSGNNNIRLVGDAIFGANSLTQSFLKIEPRWYPSDQTGLIGRGIYIDPEITGTGSITNIAFENTSGEIRFGGITQDDSKTQVLVKDPTSNQVFYRESSTIVPTTTTVNGQALSSDITIPHSVAYVTPGRYISSSVVQASVSTVVIATNFIRAYPIIIPKSVTIDEIRAEVTTGAASTTFRVAIYRDDGSSYPGEIVPGSDIATYASDVGTTVANTPGSSLVLTPGLYWIAINSNGSPTLRGIQSFAMPSVIGWASTVGNTHGVGYSIAQAYGAMPSIYPASASVVAVPSVSPLILLRAN